MSSHPLEDMAKSLYMAIGRDLPLISFKQDDYEALNKLSPAERTMRMRKARMGDRQLIPTIIKKRHPYESEVRVYMFPQTWPTKSLGFTLKNDPEEHDAYTIVIESAGAHAVYFGGKFAYLVNEFRGGEQRRDIGWKKFLQGLAERKLLRCEEAQTVYQAQNVNKFGSNMPKTIAKDDDQE